MRLKQNEYYYRYGVRKAAQLNTPKLLATDRLTYPLNSIIHYWPEELATTGPTNNEPFLNTEGGQVYIEHLTKLASNEGNPVRTKEQPMALITQFRRTHRQYHILMRDKALGANPRSILVINHAMLNHLYRYPTTYRAGYYRWKNEFRTFINSINELGERFPYYNQYFEVELPVEIPTRMDFIRLMGSISQSSIKPFTDNTKYLLFELWRWVGSNRKEGLFSELTKEGLESINFVFRAGARFSVLSFRELNSWRKDIESGVKTTQAGQYDPKQLTKLYNRYLAHVQLGRNYLPEEPAPEVVEDEVESDTNQQVDNVDNDDDDLPDLSAVLVGKNEKAGAMPDPIRADRVIDEPDSEETDDEDELPDDIDPDIIDGWDEVDEDELLQAASVDTVATPRVAKEVYPFQDEPLVGPVAKKATQLAKAGIITQRQAEAAIATAQTYKTLKDPFTGESTLEQFSVITPASLLPPDTRVAKDSDVVADKSLLHAVNRKLQQQYINEVMNKDITNAILSTQKHGLSVVGYEVKEYEDVVNHYETHRIKLKPVKGETSTIEFQIPKFDEEGSFIHNGTKYVLRNQRIDMPIRKINPDKVALTSHRKLFVSRSLRKVSDYDDWLVSNIKKIGTSNDNHTITKLNINSAFDMEDQLPYMYSLMAQNFVSFTVSLPKLKANLSFDYSKVAELYGESEVHRLANLDYVPLGKTTGSKLVVMDVKSNVLVESDSGFTSLGKLPEVLGIERKQAPLPMTEMKISDKILPVGFIVAYYYGFTDLLELLEKEFGLTYRTYSRTEKVEYGDDEYVLAFDDVRYVFKRDNELATLLLGGLRRFANELRRYSVYEFDAQDVYYRLIESMGLSARYLRELDDLNQSWMDDITAESLAAMGEPTDFKRLLVRATELILTKYSSNEVDPAFMRYRCQERFASMVHAKLHQAIKRTRSNDGFSQGRIDVPPYEILQSILEDSSILSAKEANPLQGIREQESMTYRGTGGRSNRSMVARTRIYHKNDMGTLSESTVDSGSVGVVAYLAPNAKFNSIRGTTDRFSSVAEDGNSRLFSSCTLLSPVADADDPKRQNFISIQSDAGTYAKGYDLPPLRTGYESIIATRVNELFATCAKDDGVVVSVSKRAIKVEYADGSTKTLELGLRYGNAAGITHPQSLITDLKPGDKFEAGDCIAYNEYFFTPDPYMKGVVNLKNAVTCTVAVMDTIDTLEDGSVISQAIADKLETSITEIRDVTLRFDQIVKLMVKEGDHVDLDTILCQIVDQEVDEVSGIDDISQEILERLGMNAPRAKKIGEVTKIECFYRGSLDDQNEELRKVVKQFDAERKAKAAELDRKQLTGQVGTGLRLRGVPLDPDSLVLRFYITHDIRIGRGDKGVLGNQMKTIFSRVMQGINQMEDGTPIDCQFGATSFDDRMVDSPKVAGMTNRLLSVGSSHIADVYFGKAKGKFS